MSQETKSPFQEALEAIEALSPEDQEAVLEVAHRRLIEQRRDEIAKHARETTQAAREGLARSGDVDELKRDLGEDP